MADQRAFAFAPNTDAILGRITAGTGTDELGSDNDGLCCLRLDTADDLLLSDKLPVVSDERPCLTCASVFVHRYATQRFCSHACYSASLRVPIVPRFWSHVNKNGPVHPILGTCCWLWTANCVGKGNKTHPKNSKHGQFTYTLKNQPQVHVYAHRFAWELKHGPIPDGVFLLHHCDVPPCVNDAHLFLGNQDDNMKDAAKKNRFTVPRTKTFTLAERLAIYQAPNYRGICVDLAEQHGVTKACISTIRRGRFLGSGVWAGTKHGAAIAERRTA